MDLQTLVIRSAQKAISSAITPHLRGVTISFDQELLTLRAYFDKGSTMEDKELIDVALPEMIADLWQNIGHCKYEPVDLPFPVTMESLSEWIYKRSVEV